MKRGIIAAARFRRGAQVAVVVALVLAGQAVPAAAGTINSVRPNGLGTLDCNGFSSIQKLVKPSLLCADPRGLTGGPSTTTAHPPLRDRQLLLEPADHQRRNGSGNFTDSDLASDLFTATVNCSDGSGTIPLALNGTTFALSHNYGTIPSQLHDYRHRHR